MCAAGTWPIQRGRPRPTGRAPSPGPRGATHQSGAAGELGAGEHLTLLGRRGWRLGGRRRGLLSAEERRLKVKRPPRARPPGQVPPGSRARRRPGPRAQRHASRMNGSPWTPLPRPGRLRALGLPSRRRRRRRRQRSKEWGWARRRGPVLIRAAAPGWRRRGTGRRGEDAQGHFVTTLLVTSWEGHGQP